MVHLELTDEEAKVVLRELRSRLHSYFRRLEKSLSPGARADTERRLDILRALVNDLKSVVEE